MAPSRAEKPLSEVATMREGGVMKTCRPSTVMDFGARRNKSLVTAHPVVVAITAVATAATASEGDNFSSFGTITKITWETPEIAGSGQ